jgi:type IV pilus assembly protein PilO
MTVSDYTRNDYDNRAEPAKVFGLPVPTLLGWLLGLGGLVLAGFLATQVVMPLKDEADAVKAEVEEGERRIEQKAQIEAELVAAKKDLVKIDRQKQQVMSLFAEEKNLKTILLDLNQQVEKNNARVKGARDAKIASCPAELRQQYANPNRWKNIEETVLKGPLVAEAKLKSFTPAKEGIQTITAEDVSKDTYLKPPLVGQLRRQTMDIAFEGTFAQAQSIFQAIEKLKPLLIVKELKVVRKNPVANGQTEAVWTPTPGGNGIEFLPNCQPEVVTVTSFKLDALLPLKPVEPEVAAKPAAAAPAAAAPAKP